MHHLTEEQMLGVVLGIFVVAGIVACYLDIRAARRNRNRYL